MSDNLFLYIFNALLRRTCFSFIYNGNNKMKLLENSFQFNSVALLFNCYSNGFFFTRKLTFNFEFYIHRCIVFVSTLIRFFSKPVALTWSIDPNFKLSRYRRFIFKRTQSLEDGFTRSYGSIKMSWHKKAM